MSSWKRPDHVPISWVGEDWTNNLTKIAFNEKLVPQNEMECYCQDEGTYALGQKLYQCPLQSLKMRNDSLDIQIIFHIFCLKANILKYYSSSKQRGLRDKIL